MIFRLLLLFICTMGNYYTYKYSYHTLLNAPFLIDNQVVVDYSMSSMYYLLLLNFLLFCNLIYYCFSNRD